MLKINVFPVEQPGGTFYYGKVSTLDLVGKLDIRRRSLHADGIQRNLGTGRVGEITDYLSTADAILPTPIVVSVESAELLTDAHQLKVMQIHTREDGVWGEIIDGQHRYEGLRNTRSFDNFEIPICIFVDLMIEDKATVFSTINSTQVKVPKSYIYDLFDYTDANIPAKFGHDICKTLNYDKEGPLSRRIKMLGRKLNDTEILSQAALVDAIIPLISRNEKQDEQFARNGKLLIEDESLPLRKLYLNGDTVVFSKIVRNYLFALKSASGITWENYVLRSIGIKVFMHVLGYLAPLGLEEGDLSRNFFFSKLEPIKEEILRCSTRDGTNKRVEDETVERLTQALKSANDALLQKDNLAEK